MNELLISKYVPSIFDHLKYKDKLVHDLKMLIQKLKKKGLGILISDHNVKATTDICQKIFVISSGNIISHGTPEEILNNEMVKKVYLILYSMIL